MKRKITKFVSYLAAASLLFGSVDIAAFASVIESEAPTYVTESSTEAYDEAETEATEVETTETDTTEVETTETEVSETEVQDAETAETEEEELSSDEAVPKETTSEAAVYNEPNLNEEASKKSGHYETTGKFKAIIEWDSMNVSVTETDYDLTVYMEKYGEEVLLTAMPSAYVEGNSYTYKWSIYDYTTYESKEIYTKTKTGDDAKSDTIDIGKFHDKTSARYDCQITSDDSTEFHSLSVCYTNSTLDVKVNGKQQEAGYTYENNYWGQPYNSVKVYSTSKENIKIDIDASSSVSGSDIVATYYYDSNHEQQEKLNGKELTIPYGVKTVNLKVRDGYSEVSTTIRIEYLNVTEGTTEFVGGFPKTIYYTDKKEDGNTWPMKDHDAGYPIFSAIRMGKNSEEPIADDNGGYEVKGVEVAIDDGSSQFYGTFEDCLSYYIVTANVDSGLEYYEILLFADCLDLTEGNHKVTMTYYVETLASKMGETTEKEYYAYTVSDTVNFVKDSSGSGNSDTYITSSSVNYLLPGDKYAYEYSYFNRREKDEVMNKMELYIHPDDGEYKDPIYSSKTDGKVTYYNDVNKSPIYAIDGIDLHSYGDYIPGTSVGYRTSAYLNIDANFLEKINEDTKLDVVYTSDKGNRYIKQNGLVAVSPKTKTTYVESVTPTVPLGFLGYDSTKDYVALTVYGYNVKEDTIPAFYSDSEMTNENKIAYFDADDPECALEGADSLGVYCVTLKKVNPDADIWNESGEFYYDLSDDAVFSGYSQSLYYSPEQLRVYAVEGNGNGMKLRVSSDLANMGDTLKITYDYYLKGWKIKTNSSTVKSDDLGLYVELSNSTDVYKAWTSVTDGGYFTVENTKSSESSKKGLKGYCISDGSYRAKNATNNLYVEGNHAWEIHEFSKIGEPIYEGVAEGEGDVLTPEQIENLAKPGRVYRYCIKDPNGRTIETSTITFPELWTITLMDGEEVFDTVKLAHNMSFAEIYNYDMDKSGCKFDGWYTQATGGTKISSTGKFTTKKNMTLYARWSAAKYSVVYNSNIEYMKSSNPELKASGKTSSSSMTYDKSSSLNKNKYSIPGYNFIGWNTEEDGSGTSYKAGQEVSNLTDTNGAVITLYAQWKPVEYEIQYIGVPDEVFGENMPEYAKTYTRRDATLELPETMNRVGYDFAGWYTDSGYRKPVESVSLNQTGTLKVYAKWKAHTYKVVFASSVPEEDVQNKGLTGTINPVTMTYDKVQKLPANKFKIPGYKFVGWDDTPFSFGSEYNAETLIKDKASVKNLSTRADVTLYAQWEPITYKITYKNAVDGSKGVSNDNAGEYTIEDTYKTFSIQAPTRVGYTFDGWYEDSRFRKPLDTADPLKDGTTGNKTFYAKWVANTYRVTFDNSVTDEKVWHDKVTGEMNQVTLTYDKAKSLPSNTFAIPGYTFVGWSLNPCNFSGEYNKADIIRNKASVKNLSTGADVTLYAQWAPITYKITYKNAVHGSKGVSNENARGYTIEDTYKTFSIQDPTRVGYTFDGWYEDSRFKKPLDMADPLKDGTTGNKTFYAKWKKN